MPDHGWSTVLRAARRELAEELGPGVVAGPWNPHLLGILYAPDRPVEAVHLGIALRVEAAASPEPGPGDDASWLSAATLLGVRRHCEPWSRLLIERFSPAVAGRRPDATVP